MELFGSVERQGRLIASDAVIRHPQSVVIERPVNESEPKKARGAKRLDSEKNKLEYRDTLPVYVKIDRLTGGVIGSALKHQNEIQGEAEICLELQNDGHEADQHPFLFPLVYVLRRIGAGKVPVGGRTVIGLGEFAAAVTEITITGETFTINNADPLPAEQLQKLKRYYDRFAEEWREFE